MLIDQLAMGIERRANGHPDGYTLLNDAVQIGELQSYQIKRTQDGHYRYSAPDGQHDDTHGYRGCLVLARRYPLLNDPHSLRLIYLAPALAARGPEGWLL